MNILGISTSPADQGLCLLREGEISYAIQGDLTSCLQEADLSLADIDLLVVCDRPVSQWNAIVRRSMSSVPGGASLFVQDVLPWLKNKIWMKKAFGDNSEFQGDTLFVGRHESLAAESFFRSGFENAAFLSMDKGTDRVANSWGTVSAESLSVEAEQYYPHSLELFCSAFMRAMGLATVDMKRFTELAATGDPTYKDALLATCIELKEDGSFRLDMGSFDYHNGFSLNKKKRKALFPWPDTRTGSPRREETNLARSVQVIMEESVKRTVQHIHQVSGQTKLCVSDGGISKYLDKDVLYAGSGFEDIHIQDNNSGAIGAAIFAQNYKTPEMEIRDENQG